MSVQGTKTEKNDSITVSKSETDLNNKQNDLWKNKINIDNFIIICKDIPNSMECVISFGFKNPTLTGEEAQNPDTLSGQHLRTDVFTAKTILSKTKQELYDAFMAKDKTVIIE